MSELMSSVVLLGFILGMRHATDPDHVIAVSTIVSRETTVRNAVWIGVVWGIGHSLTILVVGGAIVLLGVVIPPRLGLGMELSVAVMLIVLGSTAVGSRLRHIAARSRGRGGERRARHAETEKDGEVESHHHHGKPSLEDAGWAGGRSSIWRPFGVGVVHGLAGSAAVALLVLAVIPDPRWGMVYLLVFGLGTVAGMVMVTVATVLPFLYGGARLGAAHRYLVLASGTLSVAFGLFLVYRIGVVDGLFTAHPQWTPG